MTTILGLTSGSLRATWLTENSAALGVGAEIGADFALVGAVTSLHEQVRATNIEKKNVRIPKAVSFIW